MDRGGTAIGASAFLFGDEANLTPKLTPYFTRNLNTLYQLTDQCNCSRGENVTNARIHVRHLLADQFEYFWLKPREPLIRGARARGADRRLRWYSRDVLRRWNRSRRGHGDHSVGGRCIGLRRRLEPRWCIFWVCFRRCC